MRTFIFRFHYFQKACCIRLGNGSNRRAMKYFLGVAALTVLSLAAADIADVADMSGTWVLNVKQSKWLGSSKPSAVRLTIDHHEPKLKYDLAFTGADGKVASSAFDGTIDGKEANGVTATRLSPLSLTISR